MRRPRLYLCVHATLLSIEGGCRENLDVFRDAGCDNAEWKRVSSGGTFRAVDWAAGFPISESRSSDSKLKSCGGGPASSSVTNSTVTGACRAPILRFGMVGRSEEVRLGCDRDRCSPDPLVPFARLRTRAPAWGLVVRLA